jgi:hypothetical protein
MNIAANPRYRLAPRTSAQICAPIVIGHQEADKYDQLPI